ncbi:hypothetical protein GHT09_017357 [Marmota monax]|uniref:Uncharacterized protein n=1 Tax=Marmota monax TaxID=9995 RepID=A0A834UVC7_MARMO|nr:hypothetical protein GHT09_017357 [Marmota monax]
MPFPPSPPPSQSLIWLAIRRNRWIFRTAGNQGWVGPRAGLSEHGGGATTRRIRPHPEEGGVRRGAAAAGAAGLAGLTRRARARVEWATQAPAALSHPCRWEHSSFGLILGSVGSGEQSPNYESPLARCPRVLCCGSGLLVTRRFPPLPARLCSVCLSSHLSHLGTGRPGAIRSRLGWVGGTGRLHRETGGAGVEYEPQSPRGLAFDIKLSRCNPPLRLPSCTLAPPVYLAPFQALLFTSRFLLQEWNPDLMEVDWERFSGEIIIKSRGSCLLCTSPRCVLTRLGKARPRSA